MSFKTHITAEQIRAILAYDPETGILTWKPRTPDMFTCKPQNRKRTCTIWNNRYAGKPAGSMSTSDGYIYTGLKIYQETSQYGAHRLAWLIYYGKWPNDQLDHIDQDGTNNRISNLRECDASENGWNVRKSNKNAAGHKGVYRHCLCVTERYYGMFRFRGKKIYLGMFDNAEDAAEAVRTARAKYHGEFARHD